MSSIERQEFNDSTADLYHIQQQQELDAAPRPGGATISATAATSAAEATSQRNKSNIVEFYANRSVLITGASGFIGKVLIEKLLRTCPDIKRIFVLIRPKWNKRPGERLAELLACPLFDGVRNGADLEQRVIVVEGDVTQQNLGLSGQNLLRLSKEVSVVFHSAATVKFDEPLKHSVAINIAGTKNMVEFCRRCTQLAGLVHVSTAYANCDRDSIDEHIYPHQMDPEKLIQMADWLDLETIQELKQRLLGARPNTYTYTKALAEWLLVKSARDLPVVICRPSIVCASQEEPFRGWIDNVNGPTGVILGAGKGLIRSMYAEKNYCADLVPVDKVISLVVSLGWFASINKHQKHLNEAAESFTESLMSGGPSSVAGSSSASMNGGDDQLEPLGNSQKELNEAATLLQAKQSHGAANEQANNNTGHRIHKHRGTGSTSSSELSTPSLSGEDEDEEGGEADEEAEEEENQTQNGVDHLAGHLYGAKNQLHPRHMHHLPQHQMSQQDDGYGSRSSDYANSISSTESTSIGAIQQKRRNRRHLQAHESPIIRISSICESATGHEAATNELPVAYSAKRQRNVTPTNTSNSILANNNNNNNDDNININLDGNNTDLSDSESKLDDGGADNKPASNSVLERKLKQFRKLRRDKLIANELPEELADIPVFHCTTGTENPITWGRVQILVMAALSMFPSISTYRYPCGALTNSKFANDFYRLTLHYIPAFFLDTLVRLFGGKPVLVRIFKKIDQAAKVLEAFTLRQWDFKCDNRQFLMNEIMNDEDRRIFNCDIKSLDWEVFINDYVLGVKKFILKEPLSNLEQAKRNLRYVYYRNLSLQVLLLSASIYHLSPMFKFIVSAVITATTTTIATTTVV